MAKSVILIVLDGWGIGPLNDANPIYVVKPESFKFLEENYPITSLQASGISVGLPWGEVGNSEVGHLTLGAGKVIYQYYPKITMSIQDGTFFENPALKDAFAHAKQNNSAVNLVGLLTKANTHASLDHLQALIKMSEKEGVAKVNLHLFADGLDSPPKSLPQFLKQIPRDKLVTLTGRYYAMDRNESWQLPQAAYEIMTSPGKVSAELDAYLDNFYKKGLSEEFLPPLRLIPDREIKDGDAVIFFNFREDGMQELASAFLEPDFQNFSRKDYRNLYLVSMTRYREDFKNPVAFPADKVENPLGRILSQAGKIQLRLAETYKYAHVTYFFNGYREEPFPNEYRALVPSLQITHPDERPELMAAAITDRLIQAIESGGFDFILVNYSNPDTIAHTGNYDACLKAVRVIDAEIGRVLKAISGKDIVLIITSDHGNIEEVLSPLTGTAETQHDPNPVPFYLVGAEFRGKKFINWRDIRNETAGILADVAPTVLTLLGLPQPPEMTGKNLLKEIML
jgi:2,3-bisphosphoglycerate-independent phosphoglycerate mutase